MITSCMPNVFTADMDAALALYRDQLGFTESSRYPSEGRPQHVVLRLGDARLALSAPTAINAAGLRPTAGNPFELILSCEDVDRETQRLQAGGAALLVEPYQHVGGTGAPTSPIPTASGWPSSTWS